MDVLELPRPVINFLRTMSKEMHRYVLCWDIYGGNENVTLTLTWKLQQAQQQQQQSGAPASGTGSNHYQQAPSTESETCEETDTDVNTTETMHGDSDAGGSGGGGGLNIRNFVAHGSTATNGNQTGSAIRFKSSAPSASHSTTAQQVPTSKRFQHSKLDTFAGSGPPKQSSTTNSSYLSTTGKDNANESYNLKNQQAYYRNLSAEASARNQFLADGGSRSGDEDDAPPHISSTSQHHHNHSSHHVKPVHHYTKSSPSSQQYTQPQQQQHTVQQTEILQQVHHRSRKLIPNSGGSGGRHPDCAKCFATSAVNYMPANSVCDGDADRMGRPTAARKAGMLASTKTSGRGKSLESHDEPASFSGYVNNPPVVNMNEINYNYNQSHQSARHAGNHQSGRSSKVSSIPISIMTSKVADVKESGGSGGGEQHVIVELPLTRSAVSKDDGGASDNPWVKREGADNGGKRNEEPAAGVSKKTEVEPQQATATSKQQTADSSQPQHTGRSSNNSNTNNNNNSSSASSNGKSGLPASSGNAGNVSNSGNKVTFDSKLEYI
jgi:hypothetical protein